MLAFLPMLGHLAANPDAWCPSFVHGSIDACDAKRGAKDSVMFVHICDTLMIQQSHCCLHSVV